MTQSSTKADAPAPAPFLRDYTSETKRSVCGLTIDVGRQRMTSDDLAGLYDLARDKGVLEANAAMRRGEIVNASESRGSMRRFTPRSSARLSASACLPTWSAAAATAAAAATRSPT